MKSKFLIEEIISDVTHIFQCARAISSMVKKLSDRQRNDILSQLNKGISFRDISKPLGVSSSVVGKIAKAVGLKKKCKPGRPRKLTETDKSFLVLKVTAGEVKSSVNGAKIMKDRYNIDVSRHTVANALKEKGLHSREKKEKPLLSKKNVKDRLSFAKAHQNWTISDWKRVIFSDETKINRFNSDGRQWTWCRDGEETQDRNVKLTVKHGGGNIKLWGCMTAEGPGYMCQIESILDKKLYQEILENELENTIEYYHLDRSKIIFQHDNDPKHTAKTVKEYLQKQEFQVMIWPSQSPDLNPIEHLWAHLKRALNSYPKAASGILELWERVQDEWEKISKEVCLNLIESIPRRIAAAIKAKRKWTKY